MSNTKISTFEEVITGDDFTIPCESGRCGAIKTPTHPADMIAQLDCGHQMAICIDRYRIYIEHDMPNYGGALCLRHADLKNTRITQIIPLNRI